MIKIEFQILGKNWTIRLPKKKRYKKRYGARCLAVTDTEKRRIDLGPKGRDLETITHELVHAYLGELCTGSTDLDDDNLEEIFAEMMAKRGIELLNLAKELYNRIQEATLEPCPTTCPSF